MRTRPLASSQSVGRTCGIRNAEGIPVAPSLELWEALFLSLERLDCSRRVHQALLKCLRRRFQQPQHVVFLFPQHQPSGQLRVLEKRNLLFKAPLLQFYRLVPHETPTPGSLSEDSLLLPGRHQFELVGDVGFNDFNPTPSFSRTHASHEFVRRGFEHLSSRRLKPRVFSARLYKFYCCCAFPSCPRTSGPIPRMKNGPRRTRFPTLA